MENKGRKKGIFFYGIYDEKKKLRYFLSNHHLAIFTRKKDAKKHSLQTDEIYRVQLEKIKKIEK